MYGSRTLSAPATLGAHSPGVGLDLFALAIVVAGVVADGLEAGAVAGIEHVRTDHHALDGNTSEVEAAVSEGVLGVVQLGAECIAILMDRIKRVESVRQKSKK